MKNALMIGVALLSLVVVSACGDSRAETIAALDGDSSAGATVFEQNCQGCHGANAAGGSGPNLAGEADEPEEVINTILHGDGEMPSFEQTLTDQEIADVVAFLQSL